MRCMQKCGHQGRSLSQHFFHQDNQSDYRWQFVNQRLHQSKFSQHKNLTRSLFCQALLNEDSWISQNESKIRIAPLFAGGAGIISVVLNRALSGTIGLDASSMESRTDVIVIALSAVLLMTGLQWLALKPVTKDSVELKGRDVKYHDSKLGKSQLAELKWAWDTFKSSTRCKSMVAFYRGSCLFHYGMANLECDASESKSGPISEKAMREERGNYLANLTLYPGRFEFLEYLPENTQGVVVQSIGQEGVLVLGTDTQRGFGRLDQAWIALIADKLSSSLEDGPSAS